jgi:hypothetical protein
MTGYPIFYSRASIFREKLLRDNFVKATVLAKMHTKFSIVCSRNSTLGQATSIHMYRRYSCRSPGSTSTTAVVVPTGRYEY